MNRGLRTIPFLFLTSILITAPIFNLNASKVDLINDNQSQNRDTSEKKHILAEVSIEDPFLNELAMDTWTYMSSDWATDSHLPWSWRSTTIEGGNYVNPAEIGFYALSWLIAYDMEEVWSPNWAQAETEVIAILDQLRAWQTGSQTEQPNGPNAYNNSVFYQWYDLSSDPPVVGASDPDHLVPSIDNAWLAASLITIREYGVANEHNQITEKADAILADMDFMLWYHPSTHKFSWGTIEDPQGGTQADYYSNENRIINFVARAMSHISPSQFYSSLQTLQSPPGTYAGITVEKIAWDGSYFTYASPALFIKEMETEYGTNTITPAAQAQIAYAANKGYEAWGLSDTFDVDDRGYVQQGALPVSTPDDPETRPGLVTPHASAMALITPLASDVITNLQTISTTFGCAYDDTYGFYDSVMTYPEADDYGHCSDRFSILAQEWIFLSIANNNNGFIWDYFYQNRGVQQADKEYLGIHEVFLPTIITPPPTPPLYVADFDTCDTTNNLGGLMGAAYNLPDFMMEEFVPEDTRGCVVKLDYDIEHWAAFWLKLQYINLTKYNTLVFDLKAEAPIPGNIKLELKRFCSSGNCGEISIRRMTGITTDWKPHRISLADFGPTGFPNTPPLSSWENIEELVFTVESDHAGHEGTFYIDNIRFEYTEFEGLDSNTRITATGYPPDSSNPDIYVIDAGKNSIMNLTNTPNIYEGFSNWSADGSKLVFVCSNDDGNLDICTMNSDGTEQVNITNHQAEDTDPVWSPDSSQILFTSNRSGNYDIFRMNTDGTELVNLTNHPANDAAPDWRCAEGRIVFHSRRSGSHQLYSMQPNGTGVVQLTNTTHALNPKWSPDCSKISFLEMGEEPTNHNKYEIFTILADGSNRTNVTQNQAYEWGPAAWSPDGGSLVYLSNRNGRYGLYITSITRAETIALADQYLFYTPDWAPAINTQEE